MWGEGGVCSWQQGPGRVVRVSYEPCMWHLKDPPVPCNPGNLLAEGGGEVVGLPLSPGATSLFAYWSQGWGDSWVSLSPAPFGLSGRSCPSPFLCLHSCSLPTCRCPELLQAQGTPASPLCPKNLMLW